MTMFDWELGFCVINNNINRKNSTLIMAEEDSLAESSSKDHRDDDRNDEDDDDDEWLQLSIGGRHTVKQEEDLIMSNHSTQINNNDSQLLLLPEFRAPRPPPPPFSPYLLHQQQQQHNYNPGTRMTSFVPRHQQEINWALISRPIPISIAGAPPSNSSGSYFQPAPPLYNDNNINSNMGRAPDGLDFRVIQTPRRPHSGVWFMLQASLNQEKEPFLPQISKSYLRIKDGRMAIRLVIKYLANKLRLENESEIELRCKGQRLQPLLTLQHVRDNIWSNPRDFITLLPNSSTTHHIMVLHYARRTASN